MQQDQELLSAHPRQPVPGADRGADAPRDLDEHGVAAGVAVGVVDLLEAVDVEQQHADAELAVGEAAVELLGQRPAVRGAGQRVQPAQPIRLGAGDLQRRVGAVDLLHRGQQLGLHGVDGGDVQHGAVQEEPAALAAHAAAVTHPAQHAVGADQPVLAVEQAGADGVPMHHLEALDVLGVHVVRPRRRARRLGVQAQELRPAGPLVDQLIAVIGKDLADVDVLVDGIEDAGEHRGLGGPVAARPPSREPARELCGARERTGHEFPHAPPIGRPVRNPQPVRGRAVPARMMRVHSAGAEGTVLVVGLGDLGARILDALARRPGLGRLVAAGRDAERGGALAGQARLVAALSAGPRVVDFEQLDLDDTEAAARVIARVEPDVIVMAASQYTWWRPAAADPARAAQLAALPYAVWLPLLVPLVRSLMEARRDAGVGAPVVCLPFPDAVGPMLAGVGLAPDVGAGNVAEVAAKLAVVAGAQAGAGAHDVEVRLVMHHAAERDALSAFASLGSATPGGEPPWAAEVRVGGRRIDAERVAAAFAAPYPLPSGRATHLLTAAATTGLVAGLLSEQPVRGHAPAPAGRPGGYPVVLSRSGVALDLPEGLDEPAALALNERAARWDGIERIEPDGTAVLHPEAAAAARAAFGVDLARLAPDDLPRLASELRADAAARP